MKAYINPLVTNSNFDVLQLAINSPVQRFILKPKNITDEDFISHIQENSINGIYSGRLLVLFTLSDHISGLVVSDVLNKRITELDSQIFELK